MNFFTENPNQKKQTCFFFFFFFFLGGGGRGGEGGGEGTRVSEFFFTKNPNLK